MEGRVINTAVTGPGAAVALGLMYLKTKNRGILRKLALPETVYALSNVQPDLLMYRSLAACLVAWEGDSESSTASTKTDTGGVTRDPVEGGDSDATYVVHPTESWLSSCVPVVVRNAIFPTEPLTSDVGGLGGTTAPSAPAPTPTVTKSTAIPLYLAVSAGRCLGLGLVYAGTADTRARAVLLTQLLRLQRIRDNKDPVIACTKELRPSVELSLTAAALGLSITMAGTGDVDILRILRELRWKVDDSIYGTHMALGMSIG